MLTSSAATRDILLTAPFILTADLYKLTLSNGQVIRWSGGDRQFTIGTETFGIGPLITRTMTKRKVGIDVDSITLNVMDNGGVLLNGRSILRALHEGEFDGAIVEVRRLFLSSWDDLSPGAVDWFFGYVSDVNGDQGKFDVRVKSMLGLLDSPMPKFLYMPSCGNTFGDTACTKTKASFVSPGSCLTGTTAKSINLSSGIANVNNAGYYDLGVAKVTSGSQLNLTRTIRKHTSGVIQVSPAFPAAPGSGDTIEVYPSCTKTRTACVAYANETNFRGFPYIPAPDTMYQGGSGTPGAAPQGGTGQSPVGGGGGAYRTRNEYLK